MVWIGLALTIAAVVLGGLFQDHVEAERARRMGDYLDELTAALDRQPDGRLGLRRDLGDPLFHRPLSGLYWQVTAPEGVLLRSRSLWDRTLALPAVPADVPQEEGGARRHAPAGPDGRPLAAWERVVSLPGIDGPVRVLVAADTADAEMATASFRRALAASLLVLAAGLMAAAGAQVLFGLRPLHRLRLSLGEMRAGRATEVAGAYPPDLQPLVDELNALLSENRDMVERARTQAGNLAHALKTPLAVIANEAGTLADAEAARCIAVETDRMRRQVDLHLARARAAAATRGTGSRAMVVPVVEGIVRTVGRLHADREIVIAVAGDPRAAVRGEVQDLQEMVGNLVDNAAAWARRRVVVAVEAGGRGVRIAVDDDGPGIPEDRRATVLQRGIRLDEALPGSGLGLAIVIDLARLHGGSLSLHRSDLGGLRAVVELPGASR
jgi:signal transduction histidine kinase